ncbi:MAG TPA: rhomboid family intramembrane serine protease [Chitinophagaceae bacterium]|nr:rhomboid family intramembrane serine protease [Chitinophagaceae bacterium]
MLPIGDDNTDRRLTPIVNYALIAINVLVFVALQGAGSNEHFTYAFSTVPAEITQGQDIATGGLQPTPIPVYGTLITSMFMHGGWAHLLGNMLYLWIFGDNIESRLGHARYLIFYLLCGVIASLSHVFATAALSPENMMIPSLGASGAISGVLGGYLLLFPKRKVRALMGRGIVQVPAFVALGFWIVFQVISSMGMLGGGEQAGGGGVAYAAHIGGFIAGLALVKLFDRGAGDIPTRRMSNR